jgi:hypothetical protein
VVQRFPKTSRAIANGQDWSMHEPAAFEAEQQVLPGRFALPVAIPEAHNGLRMPDAVTAMQAPVIAVTV